MKKCPKCKQVFLVGLDPEVCPCGEKWEVVGLDGPAHRLTATTLVEAQKKYAEEHPGPKMDMSPLQKSAEALIERITKPDVVNHPPHYTAFPVEVIDIIKAALGPGGFKAYCFGSEIKYRMRAGLKGANVAEDIAKAMTYKRFREEV